MPALTSVVALLIACGGSTPPAADVSEAPSAATAPAKTITPMALPSRKDDAAQSSKNGRSEADISGVKLIVTYGRPVQKGRVLFSELVPYGTIWRTGANEATVLSVSDDVLFAGAPLEAGVYGLFTIPGETEWTVVVNSVADQWGAYDYDAGKDLLRVTVPAAKHVATEVFTIEATDKGLSLLWGEIRVVVPITAQ